jgi:HEPN domain-containing protein
MPGVMTPPPTVAEGDLTVFVPRSVILPSPHARIKSRATRLYRLICNLMPDPAKPPDTWRRAETRARRFPNRTWTNLIVESIKTVNNALARGQYFFSDIKKEGILLHDTGEFQLARPRKLDPRERRGNARAHFEQWFTSAKDFYGQFEYAFRKRKYKIAAFELHQATERFYDAVLLVFTNYRPRLHDLEKLSHMVAGHDPAFMTVFPQATAEQKECFELLRRAYVEARYNPGYKITKAQLEYLAGRVRKLQRLTKKVCEARVEAYLSA